MDYQQAIDWIMSFWALGRSRAEERALRPLKVPRMRTLLERLGSPHRKFPSLLVAGTKGKGSTCAFIAEGLRAAGYRVGRYTQPHLIDWRERTWVDGAMIEPQEVADLAAGIRPAIEQLHEGTRFLGGVTTYEVGTALTLRYFAERQVDVAVLEIGIGGRLDALNAVDPVLSVVTSISLDHTDVLGGTLGEIAKEKAGIFRWGEAAVSAPQQPGAEAALRKAALETGARLHFVSRERERLAPAGETLALPAEWEWSKGSDPDTIDVRGPYGTLEGLRVSLLGDHQRDNATVAVAALELLGEHGFGVGEAAIRRGLAEVEWPGRIQVLRQKPTVVVDAAHNADSARCLAEAIRRQFRYRRLILVFGASGDKCTAGMAAELGPLAGRVIATSSGHRRAADAESLAEGFRGYAEARVQPDPAAAMAEALALAGPEDLVLVAGSVFLAGRAIQVLSAEC